LELLSAASRAKSLQLHSSGGLANLSSFLTTQKLVVDNSRKKARAKTDRARELRERILFGGRAAEHEQQQQQQPAKATITAITTITTNTHKGEKARLLKMELKERAAAFYADRSAKLAEGGGGSSSGVDGIGASSSGGAAAQSRKFNAPSISKVKMGALLKPRGFGKLSPKAKAKAKAKEKEKEKEKEKKEKNEDDELGNIIDQLVPESPTSHDGGLAAQGRGQGERERVR